MFEINAVVLFNAVHHVCNRTTKAQNIANMTAGMSEARPIVDTAKHPAYTTVHAALVEVEVQAVRAHQGQLAFVTLVRANEFGQEVEDRA